MANLKNIIDLTTIQTRSSLVAGKYWLHQALSCFSASLESIGSHLVFLKATAGDGQAGSSLSTLKDLLKEMGARTVLANAVYEPWLKERDDAVFTALRKEGVNVKMFHSYCLRDPYSVSTEGVGLRGSSEDQNKASHLIIVKYGGEYQTFSLHLMW